MFLHLGDMGTEKDPPKFLTCLSIYFTWHIMSDYVCGSQQLPPERPNSKITWERARFGSKGPPTFPLATGNGPGKGAWPGFPSSPWSGWRKEKKSWANQIWPSQQFKLEKRGEKGTEERPRWARSVPSWWLRLWLGSREKVCKAEASPGQAGVWAEGNTETH